jgi:hypothetical protein
MVKCGVLFEVRTEYLNNIETSFGFEGLNLNSINQLIFVMVKCGVLFEVRTKFLRNILTSFGFKGLIMSLLSVSTSSWSAYYSYFHVTNHL